MGKPTVCDECGKRLDGDLDLQRQHVRLEMRVDRIGVPTVTVERDFCAECAEDRIVHFEAQPFMVGISGGPH